MAGLSLRELAEVAGAEAVGETTQRFHAVAALDAAAASDVALFHHPRYREAFAATRAGAVVVRKREPRAGGPALLVSENPQLAFAKISARLHPRQAAIAGIDPRAAVDSTAEVHASAQVGPFAYVGPGAQVGAGCELAPFSYVGASAKLGKDCRLQAGAIVAAGCILGERVVLHPGAVIGADGFGYAFDAAGAAGPVHLKVPQLGIARVEDEVEIGAHSCIDRATLGETVIGRGTKIDNLVQVAHNVRVGPLSILCAQAGVAGSATLGQGVVLGGQVGVVGHLEVGDGARIGAGSGVMVDIPAGETHSGSPTVPHRQWLKMIALERRLPELLERIAELEAKLAARE